MPEKFTSIPPSQEKGSEEFPVGVRIVSGDKILDCASKWVQYGGRIPSLPKVADMLGIRIVDIHESMLRVPDETAQRIFLNVHKSIAASHEHYKVFRGALERLRATQRPYYIRELAQELKITYPAMHTYLKRLGATHETFGISVEADRPVSDTPKLRDVRAAYAEAIRIAFQNSGTREALTPELIANSVTLQIRPAPWMVRSFLIQNPGFIDEVLDEES